MRSHHHTYRQYDCGMLWNYLRGRLGGLARFGYLRGAQARRSIPGRRTPMRGVYQGAVLHDTYSLRARVVQRGARVLIQPVLRFAPLTPSTIHLMRSLEKGAARAPRSRYVEPIGFELGGVRVESMTHRYGPSSEATVLYFHGGAFMSCGIETHRRLCERLARHTGANVISVDYVQLPEGTVADSVDDAIRAYAALLDICATPDKIIVAGDSAGGYLAMKVAELATRRRLQPPAAVVCFSPLLSLDPDSNHKAVERIDPVKDAYLPPKRLPKIRDLWMPESARIEGFASPLNAARYIASPVFMTAVEDEMLRPEVESMATLLANRGLEVETHIWRKQVHAFPVLADVLPESRHAISLASDFIRIAVGEQEREVVVGELVPEAAGADDVSDDVIEGEIVGVC